MLCTSSIESLPPESSCHCRTYRGCIPGTAVSPRPAGASNTRAHDTIPPQRRRCRKASNGAFSDSSRGDDFTNAVSCGARSLAPVSSYCSRLERSLMLPREVLSSLFLPREVHLVAREMRSISPLFLLSARAASSCILFFSSKTPFFDPKAQKNGFRGRERPLLHDKLLRPGGHGSSRLGPHYVAAENQWSPVNKRGATPDKSQGGCFFTWEQSSSGSMAKNDLRQNESSVCFFL